MQRARRPLAEATTKAYEAYRKSRLSPRIRHAARLYATAAVPTMRAAGEAVGLHPGTLSLYMQHNPEVQRLIRDVEAGVAEKSLDMSAVLRYLEVRAIAKMADLMSNASNEGIQFKATQDLLDRGPNTGKVQRSVTAALTIDGEDAKQLAAALVTAKRVRDTYAPLVQGDYEKVHLPSLPGVTSDVDAGTNLPVVPLGDSGPGPTAPGTAVPPL